MTTSNDRFRIAVIASLAQRKHSGLGRTAMMKLLYFLQELRHVPLGYAYRLYNYGPYDSQVLEDLKSAADVEAVTAQTFQWQGGIGYEIKPGKNVDGMIQSTSGFLEAIASDLDWVVHEFGDNTASDLEVASTIIYLDRASKHQREMVSEQALVSRVREIKPHHTENKIQGILADLRSKKLLEAIA